MSISDRRDETAERAARVIGSVMSRWDMDGRPDMDGGIDTLIARALSAAGLLAPAPLREEWSTYDPDETVMWGRAHFRADSEDEARRKAHGFGYAVHRRYVTDWEEA